MTRLLTVLALVLIAFPSRAAGIVDTAEVDAALARGAIIWDIREPAAYRRGHIPGAINIGDAIRVLRHPNTEELIERDRIERILGEAGIDPAREMVIYATRGSAAAYFVGYAVRYFGGQMASVFHDGIDGWREQGRPLDTTESKLPPVTVRISPDTTRTISTQEMLARIRQDGAQVLDVRTAGEFSGTDVRAIRGGHIPGAFNIPYEENWRDPQTAAKLSRRQVPDNAGMSLRPAADLKRLYAKLDPNKEVVVYCHSGTRASETAAVLGELGFRDVKIYKSSWLGWAAKLDAPAENEVFFNVGALNAQLSAMQARIEALEKELNEARGASSK
jgi:thiosulfate/3-mercaptopyruvate sulfurtransferase